MALETEIQKLIILAIAALKSIIICVILINRLSSLKIEIEL